MSLKCKIHISHQSMLQKLDKFGIKWCLLSYFSLPTKFQLIQSGVLAPIRAHRGGLTKLVLPFSAVLAICHKVLGQFSDRQVLANSANPDCSSLISVYTVCHSVCIFMTHYRYFMVNQPCSNLRLNTANICVQSFRPFYGKLKHYSFYFHYWKKQWRRTCRSILEGTSVRKSVA